MPDLSAALSPVGRRRPWSAPHVPPIRVLIVMIVALGGLEALWLAVSFGQKVPGLDTAVTGGIAATRPSVLVVAATLTTDIGSPAAMITLLVTTVAALSWRHRSVRPLAIGAGGLAALTALDLGLKSLVARPRPPLPWHAVTAQGWSFPSGHAVFSAGVLLLVVWLLAPRPGWSRFLTVAAAVLLSSGVGASRVVLAVHFPTDVLAGWCLAVIADGAVLLTVSGVGRSSTGRRPESHPPSSGLPSSAATLDHRKAA